MLVGRHGERLRRAGRRVQARAQLRAALAAAGLSNKEAVARLFLSVKTIEAHLHRTYRKLGVRSRAELAPLLAARDASA